MTEPRKASDILLGLEREVEELKKIVKLQDFMLKTIIGNCNKTNDMLATLIEVQPLTDQQRQHVKEQFAPSEPAKEAISIPAGFPIEVEREFKGQRRVNRAPNAPSTKAANADIEFRDYMAQRKKSPPEEFKAPTPPAAQAPASGSVRPEKKVPVTQRVQDNNKKDLFMAEITLVTDSGQPVLKTKTNAMGKWQAQLPPGKYVVKVVKMDTALQKKLEAEAPITIANSNNPITLPALIVNRE